MDLNNKKITNTINYIFLNSDLKKNIKDLVIDKSKYDFSFIGNEVSNDEVMLEF